MPIYIFNNTTRKKNKNKKYGIYYGQGRGLPEQSKGNNVCYLVDPPQEFDEEKKELGPDAQVWKTYVKEADRIDEELVDGWNKSMDVNLIFAALFSAISTAFVIESYKNLKPDPADVSAQTLLVISQTLSTIANGSQPTNSSPIPGVEAPPFKASPSAICVNILWFLSLSLSVAASLISMLAKEWCLEFMSGRTGPFGSQARRRQQRWDGIVEWRMKEVIVMLPSLIHLSLLLFAIELSVFLWDVHYGVAIPVVLVTVFAAGAYFASTFLPFFYVYCPYGTVLSRLYKQFFSVHSPVKRDDTAQDEVPGKALHWMIVNCETPRSVDIALQSLAAADRKMSPVMLDRCDAWTLIRQRLESVDADEEQVTPASSLYMRALESHLYMSADADGINYNNASEEFALLVLGVQSCIKRAGDYGLTSEDCTFVANRMDDIEYLFSEIDDRCLVHHIKEFSSTLATNSDPGALSPHLLTCLNSLSVISIGDGYLHPTPEFYVLTLNRFCQRQLWLLDGSGWLMRRFPFPQASPRLIDTLSKSGVLNHLVNLLERNHRGEQAFATAQLWLLFNMSIQAPDRTIPALSTLETMLLQYPGLKKNPENQEVVAEELEFRLMTLMSQGGDVPEWAVSYDQVQYPYRVLECMLQQRCTPLPEMACNYLQDIPESLRGIASFVDLEAEMSDPSPNHT
ncbi:unnamed protein product, partial [Rhizoctonia solani]